MADFEISVDGLADLEKGLLSLGADLGFKTLRTAGRKSMKPVLTSAINGANVQSGDLRDAIAISAKKGKGNVAVSINVGATKKKAAKKQGGRTFAGVNQKSIAQEYGTKKQSAKPFLRPALDKNAGGVLSTLKKELAIAIKKAAAKIAKGAKK